MPRSRPAGDRMLKAHKAGWPRLAVHRMILWKLRGGLNTIRAQGIDRVRQTLDQEPGGLLFLANHSCWWDLFLAHYLNEAVPLDGYGMMEHFNLQRFGFFRRIGAFSVDRTDPASVRASIDYTAELLAKPRAGVWLFPQGRIASNDVRPLGFQPGLRLLLRRTGRIRIVPVALRYEFWQEERPEALVRFGEPTWVEAAERSQVLDVWEQRLTAELDALRVDAIAQAADRFTVLFAGKRSINDRYARVREQVAGPTPGVPASSLPDRDR